MEYTFEKVIPKINKKLEQSFWKIFLVFGLDVFHGLGNIVWKLQSRKILKIRKCINFYYILLWEVPLYGGAERKAGGCTKKHPNKLCYSWFQTLVIPNP